MKKTVKQLESEITELNRDLAFTKNRLNSANNQYMEYRRQICELRRKVKITLVTIGVLLLPVTLLLWSIYVVIHVAIAGVELIIESFIE